MADLNFLRTFTAGDEEKMAKYIKMFLQSSPVACDKARAALAAGDMKALQVVAHSMKPQLRYMGLEKLALEAADVEHKAEENALDAGVLEAFLEKVKVAREDLENELLLIEKK